MNKYELTVALEGSATAAKKKATEKLISEVIKNAQGKVGKMEDWGFHDLAHQMRVRVGAKIKKIDTGIFLYFPLELKKDMVKDISEKLNSEKSLIRYLLVRSDD